MRACAPSAVSPGELPTPAAAIYTACREAAPGLSVIELAARLGLPRGVVTVLAEQLRDAGLVQARAKVRAERFNRALLETVLDALHRLRRGPNAGEDHGHRRQRGRYSGAAGRGPALSIP